MSLRNDAIYKKFLEIKGFLQDKFIGKNEDIYVILLSLIAKQHCLLIGPPGTAKSAIISMLVRMFNVPYFEYLLTKFTRDIEIFGSVDFKKLREEGVVVFNTKNKLPEAKICFLDEVFKASSVILNTLLTILSERKFYNGPNVQKVPLHSAFLASNELPPPEAGLGAFVDRLLMKHYTKYIEPELWEEYLARYWELHLPKTYQQIPRYDFQIIDYLHSKVYEVDFSNIKKSLVDLLRKLSNNNIVISDRTKGRILFGIASNAVYFGRTEAVEKDLYVLKYVTAVTENVTTTEDMKEQINLVEQIIIDMIGKEEKAVREIEELIPQLKAIRDKIKQLDDINEIIKYIDNLKTIKYRLSQYEVYKSDKVIKKINEARQIINEINDILKEKVVIG